METRHISALFGPFELPCGAVLKNRIAKAAMSDSLGDGPGDPTDAQIRFYERWAEGGLALSIIGELQGNPHFAEKPGNLVLAPDSVLPRFRALAQRGGASGAHLWLQPGHAGAMAHPPIGTPKGPSALDLPGLSCAALTPNEIRALPAKFARTARLAQNCGFGGVRIHAAHGFLLSQFLSPLFNRRNDRCGGSIANRMRLLLEVIEAVRHDVDGRFPVALKLNATDQLEGGRQYDDALAVVDALSGTGIDLIDISGGTYFSDAHSASDSAGAGPYFLDFATRTRALTRMPLMLTDGFKTARQASDAIAQGTVDMVGLARALALEPALPQTWQTGRIGDPAFPYFTDPPEGGITAWYTMRLAALGQDRDPPEATELQAMIAAYVDRDMGRIPAWRARFPT